MFGSLHGSDLYLSTGPSDFPYASPGVTVDVSTLVDVLSYPSDEPVMSTTMRKYDLSYLSTDMPIPGSSSSVQDSAEAATSPSPVIDVHGAPAIDVHAGVRDPRSPAAPSPPAFRLPDATRSAGPALPGLAPGCSRLVSSSAPTVRSPPTIADHQHAAVTADDQPASPVVEGGSAPSTATPVAGPGHAMVTRT